MSKEKINVIEIDNGIDKKLCRSRSEARRFARMNPTKWGEDKTTLILKKVNRSELND